jgi:hypothetical protein
MYFAFQLFLKHYGKEVDIFALGLILAELLHTCFTESEKIKVKTPGVNPGTKVLAILKHYGLAIR